MHSPLKRFISLLVCLVALLSVPAAMMASQTLSDEDYLALEQALLDESKDMPIQQEFHVKLSPDDVSAVQGLDDKWVNILLLGTDTGNISLNYGRTDTMIIMSVNKQTGKVCLASLVRDMYIMIPVIERENRINTANAFGGPLLAIKAVNETFGLNITNYVSINFSGFKKVIDSLGGVELVLKPSESQIVGAPHSDGPVLLNGEQALSYVRIRSLDDNFGRNERQRKLLTSLFNKMLSGSSMQQATTAMMESIKHMATNLSLNDLLTLVVPIFSGMSGMETIGFPQEGDFQGKTLENGASVIFFDQEATSQKLHDYIFGD